MSSTPGTLGGNNETNIEILSIEDNCVKVLYN